jgi:hypothetical protein
VYIDEQAWTTDLFPEGAIEDAGIGKDIITLDDDEYFMLCDNYNNSSNDSRSSSIGVISKSQIEGRVR